MRNSNNHSINSCTQTRPRAMFLMIGWALVSSTVVVHAWVAPTLTVRQLGAKPLSASSSSSSSDKDEQKPIRGIEESETPSYPKHRHTVKGYENDFDSTGGRPGAIIETEEQLATKDAILSDAERMAAYPDWLADYGELVEDETAPYDTDDPNAVDMATLGTWTIQDLRSRFPYEWDPNSGEADPNIVEMNQDGVRYIDVTEKDDDNVEVGYNPIFGPSNPVDTRTILGAKDSYMVDDMTRDDSMLTPLFSDPTDPELAFNEDVVQFRKSLDIMETYIDPFLPETMIIPRHVAKWHGYPEPTFLEPRNFTNNRFTDAAVRTDFDALTPFEARQTAVRMARAKNAEWLPDGVSQDYHARQRQPYEAYAAKATAAAAAADVNVNVEATGTLVGTLRPGRCDPEIVELIQPALSILGSCVELLSVEATPGERPKDGHDNDDDDEHGQGMIFRFYYHGLMKHKHGISCWTKELLTDCGVDVTGVIFETGFRRRDRAYDGGDAWYGPQVNMPQGTTAN